VEVRIGHNDNLDLYGWYFAAPNARYVVLINHGNGGNMSVREDLVELLLKQNLSVMIYDYAGYGKSQGLPDTVNVTKAADCAFRFLTDQKHYRANQIIVYGESLGGAVAARLASQFKPAGLIIQSGFSSLRSVAYEHFPLIAIYPDSLCPQPFFDTLALLPTIHAPILIIHGEQDTVVPFHHAEDIYKLASEPKSFIKLPLAHHADVIRDYSEEVSVAIKNFVEQLTLSTIRNSAKGSDH